MPGLITTTLSTDTLQPKDYCVIDMSITTPPGGLDLADIANAFNAVSRYWVVPVASTGDSVNDYMSPIVNTAIPQILRYYDLDGHLDGSPHGSPVASLAFDFDHTGAAPLPSELAVVTTLEGVGYAVAAVEVGVTRPKARKAGRWYVGPLAAVASAVVSGVARVSADCQRTLLDAAVRLNDELNAIDPACGIGQWSRADAAMHPLEGIRVDNAFDVQERRGEAASLALREAV